MSRMSFILLVMALLFPPSGDASAQDSASVSGELKQWHKVTLTVDGPHAKETDSSPNPFTDYRMTVTFTHESGSPRYEVPGYFAADGNAGETSATEGNKWRAHLSPDKPGEWTYRVSFVKGRQVALDRQASGDAVEDCDGLTGSFEIAPTDKSGRDLRAHGRLEYVGKHYLRFAGSGEYFLKAGADAPETLLGYVDFDGTETRKVPLKTWQPHVRDWNEGDPTWKDGKGKGLIGALNYLAGKGCNVVSFLPYNAGGDGDNVWPFVAPEDKLHYDCSKLDQWQVVFDHGTALGMYLHFKLQETENDDNNRGHREAKATNVPASLDGGDLGIERKLYLRELIARFSYELALNWNLGEENTQSTKQQREMAQYIHDTDPYDHHIVVHTFPNQQDKVYLPLLGNKSTLTGASLQNSDIKDSHWQVVKWVSTSAEAGKPWVVAFDEAGNAQWGEPPDPGYEGFDGTDRQGKKVPFDLHDVRKQVLWGTLLAGGAGVEYYFGYQLPANDLTCEDFRSRDRSWDFCRIALDFFRDNNIPFHAMKNADDLVGNPEHDNSKYCFAKAGELYLVYLPDGGSTTLDLSNADGTYKVAWFNPRSGGELTDGSVAEVAGGETVRIGTPPADTDQDWLAIIRR
ncbi:hypothetical protein Mal4_38830 [Maioricimonas rarisocia]|uniref:DUF5060 domain-containing protein n=2 Tax=Maioricimonas rarisocia TaxID=2528026 RepID=A0A517ZAQ3_9PLAN|nr:hypothetical protein Mal4_38830 [Maioricimonas rarisocia]